ncbi:PilZ domain-containing protein [Tsuneonella sp. HG222]
MTQTASEIRSFTDYPPSAAEAEQREAARFTPLIRSAKLVSASGEFLCVVSDVSSTGVSMRLFHDLPADRALELEMPNGDRLPLEPVWQKDARAGFRFLERVDLGRLLKGKGEWPKRPIRLNLEMPVELSGLTGRFRAQLRNISLQGAQVECDARLAIDQRLRLSSECLPEIETKVRWRHDRQFGLVFDSLLQFADLARTAAFVQGVHPAGLNA